jgi:hypothetical protein
MTEPSDRSEQNPPKPDGGSTDEQPWTYDLEPADASAATAPEVRHHREHQPPAQPGRSSADAAASVAEDPTGRSTDAAIEQSSAPFVRGFGSMRPTLWILGVTTVLAMVMAGVHAGNGSFAMLAAALARVLLTIAVGGMIGTLATIAAARCVGTRVAEPELFAARMLLATAAFALLYETGTPIPSRVDDWLLGASGFAFTVWLTFRLTARQTGLVLVWHGGLILLIWIAGWSMAAWPRDESAPRQTLPLDIESEAQLPPAGPAQP